MALLYVQEMDSPLGRLRLIADQDALRSVVFPLQQPDLSHCQVASNAVLDWATRELTQYFSGDLQRFSVPLQPVGTDFQQSVWRALTTIPFGETRSYGWLANALGRPSAARAVGAANGRNPLPIVVPCHRVIGASGKLTGFSGGVAAKKTLLEHEARMQGR